MRFQVFTFVVFSTLAPGLKAAEAVSFTDTSANPMKVSGMAQRTIDAAAKGWPCKTGNMLVSEEPLMELTVEREIALTITADEGHWLMRFDERFVCSADLKSARLRYTPNRTYSFYAAGPTADEAAAKRTLSILDEEDPAVRYADVRRQAVPASLAAPFSQDITLATERDETACSNQQFARTPDVILSSEANLSDVVVEALAPAGNVGLRVERLQRGVPFRGCYPARSGPVIENFNGDYAVWVGGGDDAPASVSLRVRDRTTALDRFAVTPIAADAPLAARTLLGVMINLPLSGLDEVKSSATLSEEIWLKVPKELIVFAAADFTAEDASFRGPGSRPDGIEDFPKKNEPLLVRQIREKAEVLTVDGQRYLVSVGGLTTSLEGKVKLPRRLRESAGPTNAERLAKPPKKYVKAVKKLEKQKEKAAKCYAKKFARADKEKKASEADIEKFYKGDVAEWAQGIDKKTRKRCKMARIAKAERKVIRQIKSAEARPRKKALKKISKRVKRLLK